MISKVVCERCGVEGVEQVMCPCCKDILVLPLQTHKLCLHRIAEAAVRAMLTQSKELKARIGLGWRIQGWMISPATRKALLAHSGFEDFQGPFTWQGGPVYVDPMMPDGEVCAVVERRPEKESAA